jgi:hypothetical protein
LTRKRTQQRPPPVITLGLCVRLCMCIRAKGEDVAVTIASCMHDHTAWVTQYSYKAGTSKHRQTNTSSKRATQLHKHREREAERQKHTHTHLQEEIVRTSVTTWGHAAILCPLTLMKSLSHPQTQRLIRGPPLSLSLSLSFSHTHTETETHINRETNGTASCSHHVALLFLDVLFPFGQVAELGRGHAKYFGKVLVN